MRNVIIVILTGIFTFPAYAVLPDDAYDDLREDAGTVVEGIVLSIDETGEDESVTSYHAEVKVTAVERGDVERGDTIYIDYSVPNEEMPGPGHIMIWPDATFKLWLNGGDGGVYAPAAYKRSATEIEGEKKAGTKSAN
ncbi:MAG: hypothetical protein JSW52_09200 [Candidatus Coatesbacteria bacterium]|nr:MAG: hypothetical protein JSW52_09200 [Candidatus Coatesbacteria bacterium]